MLVDGFDPVAHWALPELAGIPGWRSNEPGALERAGLEFDLYDPADFDIPGSFGVIYTSQSFLDEHPSAAEDFMRATMRGLADAIADPAAAAAVAVERINGNGNPNFLSPEGETFRWATDAETIVATTPDGSDIGVPVGDELEQQIDVYAEIGYFGDDDAPDVEGRYDPDLVADLYDDNGHRHLADGSDADRHSCLDAARGSPRVTLNVHGDGVLGALQPLADLRSSIRACSTSSLSWATRASMPANLRSDRRKLVNRIRARSQ